MTTSVTDLASPAKRPILGVLFCLRYLCQWAEKWKKPQIGWGGTTQASWEQSGGLATFRFTDPLYRQQFIEKANELLRGR